LEIRHAIIGRGEETRPSVPSLFRLMLINTTKRHEPTLNEIPAQRHGGWY
jgi:hypothetical protein